MCVIMVVEHTDPALTVVQDCWNSNAFGAGIAWREDGAVRWSKGGFDSPADLHQAILQLPKPYVVHFRIPTVGDTCDALCHPFPIGGSLALAGTTVDGVIAHNGHWREWQNAMLRFLGTIQIPDGPWSDSRAIAWITERSGSGFLELVDEAQRVVLLTPTRLRLFGHWTRDHGVTFSNMTWAAGELPWHAEWPGVGYHRSRVKGCAPSVDRDEEDSAVWQWE